MDMSPYRDLFVSEAHVHLASLSELILRLEDAAGDSAVIDEIFRHAHSLKGMAATMGYATITRLAHSMEDQLGHVRSGEIAMSAPLADLLLECGDALTRMVSQVESGAEIIEDAGLLAERVSVFTGDTASSVNTSPEPADIPVYDEAASLHKFRQSDSFKSVRIKTEILDHLVNITGELITNRYRLADCARHSGSTDMEAPLHELSGLLRELRDQVFRARMLPFSLISERFPRLVRDLAHAQHKEITFQIEGKEIELDRGILEEISDPIVHLLRNAVDHGMDTPAERQVAGKPHQGTIRLTMTRDKDHVEITIADDGRGLDPEQLKSTALDKGLITAQQAAAMSTQDAYMLICIPGFSTARTISDISGRGVGMDAVRAAVQALAGVLSIQSQPGCGSTFVLRLPITVSIIHALLVKCGLLEVAFPLNAVTRTLELEPGVIRSESGQQMITFDDTDIPVRSLGLALRQLDGSVDETALLPVVVCDLGGHPVGFIVDRIRGQQEIFVRPLKSPLTGLQGISGATVTGDGRVIFIVDAASL
ncbi:MAG TPA: chemotaxis protein CheA [Desulfuromonadales bacterium]|nr:chemotaxis protein CheA [Desulfuromonadales bacterium]